PGRTHAKAGRGSIVPGTGLAAVARHGGEQSSRPYRSNATVFDSVPTPETVTSTTSPSVRYSGGTRESPTPPGVPVAITSPACSVMPLDRYTISSTIEKIRFRVLDDWRCSPLTDVAMSMSARSTPSAVITHGPIGANVSKL